MESVFYSSHWSTITKKHQKYLYQKITLTAAKIGDSREYLYLSFNKNYLLI